MTRNLLLSGGVGHEFRPAAASLVEMLTELGVESTVVEEPADAVAHLRAAADGREPAVALFTVHALHWRMESPRYAHLRDQMARSLSADDVGAIDGFVRGGGGMLALHTAVICFDADPTWRELCGAAWDWSASSHPPPGRIDVELTGAGVRHPVTAGVEGFWVEDELYGSLDTVEGLVPLLTGRQGDVTGPVLWARELGGGRVVTDLLGHGVESLARPEHRRILRSAATWALGDRVVSAREGGPEP